MARNLRRLRIKAGVSQELLAVDAGIDRTYVSRIERGLENPTVTVLEKLSLALGCEIADLFKEDDGTAIDPLKPGRKAK